MQVSSRISASFLCFFRERNWSVEDPWNFSSSLPLFEDVYAWHEAQDMEEFLKFFEERKDFLELPLITKVAYATTQIQGWGGGLDEVLKLTPSCTNIFSHPETFFSYFVRPLKVTDLKITGSYNFRVSEDFENYPRLKLYLLSILENLPSFMGEDRANVKWEGKKVSIFWKQRQRRLAFDDRYWNPRLIKRLASFFNDPQIDFLKYRDYASGEGLDHLVLSLERDILKLKSYIKRMEKMPVPKDFQNDTHKLVQKSLNKLERLKFFLKPPEDSSYESYKKH